MHEYASKTPLQNRQFNSRICFKNFLAKYARICFKNSFAKQAFNLRIYLLGPGVGPPFWRKQYLVHAMICRINYPMKVDRSMHKFAFITDKFRWTLAADFKDQNGIQVTVLILDQTSARITKVAYSVSKSQ